MAVYRQVQISYWQDKFVLRLTPEEKFFYLYLLTNSKTKQCGIYELPLKIIEIETGYNRETVIKLLQKFIEYDKIKFDWENEEIFILNWLKHNPARNPNIKKCIIEELKEVKNAGMIPLTSPLREYLTASKPLTSPLQASLQKEKEKEKEKERGASEAITHTLEDKISILWQRTWGRSPKLPEREATEQLISKFGENHTFEIMNLAVRKNFKSIDSLIRAIDESGNIKEFDNEANRRSNDRGKGSIDYEKYDALRKLQPAE